MIRVFVVSGIRLYREGLADLISRREGFVVVGTAADGPGSVACVLELPVDIILVDMARGGIHSLVRLVKRAAPDIKIVGLAVPETDPEVVASAEAGLVGFVRREASIDELIAAIMAAARGEVLCSPRVAASLLRRVASAGFERKREPVVDRLTMREHEVLDLIQAGLSNKEIAKRLTIALATVKNHVHNILRKLDLHRRAQAVALMKE